jgi:hypothetical protein
VFCPSPDAIDNLAYRCKLRDLDLVREFFAELPPGNSYTLERLGDCSKRPRPQTGLRHARHKLSTARREHRRIRWGSAAEAVRRADSEYAAEFDRSIVTPLVEKTQKTSDPAERAVLLALASMSRVVDRNLLLLEDLQQQRIETESGPEPLPPAVWQQTEATLKALLQLTREEQRLRQKGLRSLALLNGATLARDGLFQEVEKP